MQQRVLLSSAPKLARSAVTDGLLAGALSAAVLLWRGRRDAGHAAAPVNAVAHWFAPQQALRENAPSWRYTGTGAVVHLASSVLWATAYGWLRQRRRRPNVANALGDAAAVTAAAAVVDLKLVPERLTPGFEHRLSRGSLALVYAGFALGLALAGAAAARRP